MSSDQNDPRNESTQAAGNNLPSSDRALIQTNQPLIEVTGVQDSAPSMVVLTRKQEDSIPGYQILEKLGRGGMGVVHLAKDLQADRLVALKRMLHDSDRREEESRFHTEAQAMARLDHPQIVQIFDVSEYLGRPYFTMEYCPGGSLADYLDRKPQTPTLCASIAEKIALAIHHAHENGIAHRDLKPSNILIACRLRKSSDHSESESSEPTFPTGYGTQTPQWFSPEFIRITDFGLAKKLEGDSNLTQTKAILGTPSYMAPEQATSTKQAGPTADIWAIGVMLYEMITGSLPFVGADSVEVIDHLRSKDPVPPSEKVKVPKDLETICLKCLRKDSKDRYVTAKGLAEDLRAFLEERSISARPMTRIEKSIKWIKKNPSWTAMIALFIVTLLTGMAISLWQRNEALAALKQADKERTRRALAQVDTLLIADSHAVPTILKNLEEERDQILPRLREIWAETEPSKNPLRRLRAALALLPIEPDRVREYLVQGMLEVMDPAELVVIRDALKSEAVSLTDQLWKQAETKAMDPNQKLQKLRLLAVLAAFDAENPKWKEVGEIILQPWLSDNPLYLGTWTEAFRPVRNALLNPIQKVFLGESLPELKLVATSILADYASDQPEILAALIQLADDRQFDTLFPVLEKHRPKIVPLLQKEIAHLPPKEDPPTDLSIKNWKPIWSEQEQETFAKKRSGAALALMRLGESPSVWQLLKSSPYPEARTRFIHRLASTRMEAKILIDRLGIEKDVGIRRALILALGEYAEKQIPLEVRQPLMEMLLKWYREDPDSGIHGAIDWLLRPEKDGDQDRPLKWGQREQLETIDQEMAEKVRDLQSSTILGILFSNPTQPLALAVSPFAYRISEKSPQSGEWWVNGQGQTFAIVESSKPFVMGSPKDEIGRQKDETLHWRKIERKFGLQTKAVTTEEFQRFLLANPKVQWNYSDTLKLHAPEAGCPIVVVSWWEAAQYCRWLSEKEGLPEWEMVYPSIEEIERAKDEEKPLVLPPNYLSRKGYRLPTEAEWEYSARSGSRTSRCYGSSVELLPRYSWFNENGKDRSWPVGQKKPNDWGLFDLHGNSWAWCQKSKWEYEEGTMEKPFIDKEDKRSVTEELLRPLRGGSFIKPPEVIRSSYRASHRPSFLYISFGFRLCRTFD